MSQKGFFLFTFDKFFLLYLNLNSQKSLNRCAFMLNKWINIDWIQPDAKYLQHDPLKMTIKNEILQILWWFSSRINILIFIRTIKIFLLKNLCVFIGMWVWFGSFVTVELVCGSYSRVFFFFNEALLKRYTHNILKRVWQQRITKKETPRKKKRHNIDLYQ